MGNCETRHSRKYSISVYSSRNYTIWFSTFPPPLLPDLSPTLCGKAASGTQCRSLEHFPPPPVSSSPNPPHASHTQSPASFQFYLLKTPSLHPRFPGSHRHHPSPRFLQQPDFSLPSDTPPHPTPQPVLYPVCS